MKKPSPWSSADPKGSCVAAGVALEKEQISFKRATPILYPENLGLAFTAFDIPSSELAMHVHAAGAKIIAFFITEDSAHVVYDNDEGCETVSGAIYELLTPEIARAAKQFLAGP